MNTLLWLPDTSLASLQQQEQSVTCWISNIFDQLSFSKYHCQSSLSKYPGSRKIFIFYFFFIISL